ncbi:unnamed protein product [Rhizophagus irregularis]|nr:unnamed protein product [Rhizophagus irregularis]CAB4434718.1 unnamed protein product [Rhizophagus irregularis]
MMGEEKATSSTLATAAEELNDYFKFWNMLALLTDGKWLLIDFEEAARIGDERNTLRIAAPEYENGIDIC